MRRFMISLLLSGTTLVAACQGENASAPAEAEVSSAALAPDIDPRDQYTLAHAITEARRSRDDLPGSLARTRAAWVGQRYRWEVAFVPALCGSVGSCVVMPFDHQRSADTPIRQGWLPRLELSADEHAALVDACHAHQRCVLDLSGNLRQFELSTEKPTSLTLTDIKVHRTRAATSTESWVRGVKRPSARPKSRGAAPQATLRLQDSAGKASARELVWPATAPSGA